MKTYCLSVLLLLASSFLFAQTGITIGPPRVYFTISAGQSQTEKVLVSNPSKDYALDLGVSFEDWEYNKTGENVMHEAGTLPSSCAPWVTVPQSFFSLAPQESKEIEVQMSVPPGYRNDTVPVHTCMLYVTQLNPREGIDKDGANIRIAVRTGIKLYQRPRGAFRPEIEITNFRYEKSAQTALILSFENTGTVWADGNISAEILNQSTGVKTTLPTSAFYSMPGNIRDHLLVLPANLEPGRYIATAIVNYGDADTVKLAELDFGYENK